MPGNRKLQRNGNNGSGFDRVEEVMTRLKVEHSDDNGRVGDVPDAYPDRPGEPDCIYYLRTGSCGYGSNCRFNHPSNGGQVYDARNTSDLPERAGQPDCVYYLKTGTCKYGFVCKYHHPKDKQPDFIMNVLGLPMRQDAKPCPYYMRMGSCKYGSACKFHHPPPELAGNVLPVVGPVYGSGSGSTVVPSSGATSVGQLSAASLSKPTYFANSLQLPQSYMPLYLSPAQGWNTYMGSVGPISVTSVLTSPATTNGQLSVPHLPERPDQPECRYFMSYGSCKYGSECKYHHPRDKSCSIGPLGLPLRPGQIVCSYYSLYGLCKYGPTCRFDHPLNGYSYAYSPYSLGLPPLATAYPPSTSYMPFSDSKASKVSDWVKKGSTAGDHMNQNANIKILVDSPDSLRHSSKDRGD
ncbi:hypothetical protein OROMI_017027 [Orobanche minor]